MRVIKKTHRSSIASVYIARTADGHLVEFVESIQPPLSRREKWVIILSSLVGCPAKCKFCEAGGNFKRILSKDELFFQIRYLLDLYGFAGSVPSAKFKIQFARIGEPSFNNNVLMLLEDLPSAIDSPGLLPCISTIAPQSRGAFFEMLLEIKNRLYKKAFQLQFSVHSTDRNFRDYLLPLPKWPLEQIADYGRRFYNKDNRKITLNFAPSVNTPVCPEIIKKHFDPDIFLLKFTPINPTSEAKRNRLKSLINPRGKKYDIIEKLRTAGFDVILSLGEYEENRIGSNCGQYITNFNKASRQVDDAYTYPLENVSSETKV